MYLCTVVQLRISLIRVIYLLADTDKLETWYVPLLVMAVKKIS